MTPSNIRSSLLRIMENYLTARRENFVGHKLGHFVRREIPKQFAQLSFIDTSRYMITASVGQGN